MLKVNGWLLVSKHLSIYSLTSHTSHHRDKTKTVYGILEHAGLRCHTNKETLLRLMSKEMLLY